MDAFTPQQTTELVSRIGTKKSHMRLDKLLFNSMLSGPLLGFGCAVMTSTETAPWYQENAPGLIRTIGAMFFPVGLIMIVLTGADLFTSNVMFMSVAALHRRITIWDLLINWVISFLGNLAGMLAFMAIITGYGGVFNMQMYKTEVFNFATMKILTPRWHQIFLRAIGANWLVCLAVFFSISSREIVSKTIAIWWPTATFVALGLDHVVANMYFLPNAIFYGHPDFGVGMYIWKSMIPTTIGNILGGSLFVGTLYWYLYLTGLGQEEIRFDLGSLDVAMEVGGPMGRAPRRKPISPSSDGIDSDANVLEGREPEGSPNHFHSVPSTTTHMASAISNELNAEKYAKPKSEVRSEGNEV